MFSSIYNEESAINVLIYLKNGQLYFRFSNFGNLWQCTVLRPAGVERAKQKFSKNPESIFLRFLRRARAARGAGQTQTGRRQSPQSFQSFFWMCFTSIDVIINLHHYEKLEPSQMQIVMRSSGIIQIYGSKRKQVLVRIK